MQSESSRFYAHFAGCAERWSLIAKMKEILQQVKDITDYEPLRGCGVHFYMI